MKKPNFFHLLSIAAISVSSAANAADSAALGTTLTPIGAVAGASSDGTIPAWKNESQKLDGWAFGKARKDFWKGKTDKPLYTITSANFDKYSKNLTPGQVELFKQNTGFQMEVYPSRRSCGVADFIAENTKKNVGTAKLGADGWSLADAVVPGIPFPMPTNGTEAMWNMKLRYRGVGMEWKKMKTYLSPRRGSDDVIEAVPEQTYFFPWAKKGSSRLADVPNYEGMVYVSYSSPTALAGQALVGSGTFTEAEGATYYYFPGQRRVRRMPAYAYDAPQLGYENQYLVDEAFMFTGALDRFNWKLVGKKEVLVPYNALGVYDHTNKAADNFQKMGLNSDLRRYELHRVWVIDANVKNGVRHVSPRKTYYLDEDSWSPLLAEDYDAQGTIWKLREGYLIPVFETGGCDVSAFAQYNIRDGRYIVDNLTLGAGTDTRWITEPSGPKFTTGFYTGDNLRAISER